MRELKALLPYLKRYRGRIAIGLATVLVSNAVNVWSLEFVKKGVDALGRADTSVTRIGWYAAATTGLALVAGAGRYWMREILNGVSRRVEADLRDDFFGHLLRLDAGFYATHPTGEIMSRATADIQAVRMVAGPAYMYLVNTVVFGVMAIARMAMVDVRMTVLALLPMLLLPPTTIFFGKLIHDRFEKIQEQLGVMSTMAQENLAGQRIVKAYGQEEAQSARFRGLAHESLRRNVALSVSSGFFYPALGVLAGSAMALALWLGGRQILAGRITTGELVLFLLYLGMLSWPMIALGWVVNLFQRGAASMGRVSRVLDQQPLVRDAPGAVAPAHVRGEVEFRGVSFAYPGTARAVLRDVSFRVPAGATAAIVGPTGSGKSTVVSLLARLHDPTEGEVLLDGIPVRQWRVRRLREAIALVPQDTFLFSDTLAENLALGLEEGGDGDARMRRITAAAQVAQLHETVREFPGGYETMLGERGINLSGGQKQRAALARAVARDAPVLVLDDALSAVDTHTEHGILQGLRGVFAGRTSIIVSHRVTAVMNADLILVLDDGRLVEQGTHAELLRAGGVYAALQRRQLLAEQVAGDDLLAGAGGGV
ncbi:MAG TPA: ABC transporter ATP-binding protein [Longimicrobium sp.]|nr:ABC transporter ATP-binding protein [Longimicrobium sp.]